MGLSEDIQRMEQELEELRPLRDRIAQVEQDTQGRVTALMGRIRDVLDEYSDATFTPRMDWKPVPLKPLNLEPGPTVYATPPPVAKRPEGSSEATGLELRILRSLAEFAAIGRTEIPRAVLSAWAESRGGYFNNTLGKMKTAGLIHYPSAGTIGLAEAGKAIAPKVERLPNRRAFFEACVTQAGTGLPERIMRELYTHYPNGLSRDHLSLAVKASGGYYNNTVGTLRTAGFIEYPSPGAVRLQPWTQMQ